MRTSLLFLAIAGLAVARPLVDETQVFPSIQQEHPQGDPYGQLQVSHVDGDDEEDLPPGTGSACNKVFGAMKGLLNKQLTNSKLIPWQPAVPAWWKQNDSDMLQQVVTVHKVASDDFDAYVLWVADHPNVPDDQRHASYLAAQRIIEVTRAAKIDGPYGAFHLVTRASKWLLIHPKPVAKWKQACNVN